jgi:predicted PurR-regulated permease PerM
MRSARFIQILLDTRHQKLETAFMINMDEKQKFYSFLAAFFGGILVIAWLAPGAFKSLVLAFALAYLLDPAVDWLEHRKMPRVASILVILLLVGGALAVILSYLIPYLWSEAVQFIHEAPELAEKALVKIAGWSLLPEEMTRSLPELLKEIKGRLLAGGWSTIKPLLTWLLGATSGLMGSLLAIVSLVVIPVFFFFILKDIDRLRDSFYRFVPDPIEDWVRKYFKMVDGVLSGFIRGQIMVALSLAVLYSVGLGITGIRFGVLIGVVAGILFIVPYVGTVIGLLASAMVLLVDFSGWGQVMGVVATFGVAQAIEGYVLTPRIVGNRVGLNQLETLIAILVGGEMGGLAGLIIAIPAGGILKNTIQFLLPDKPSEPEGEGDSDLYQAAVAETENGGNGEMERGNS